MPNEKSLKESIKEFLHNFHQEVMYYYMTEEGLKYKGNVEKYANMICEEFNERMPKPEKEA